MASSEPPKQQLYPEATYPSAPPPQQPLVPQQGYPGQPPPGGYVPGQPVPQPGYAPGPPPAGYVPQPGFAPPPGQYPPPPGPGGMVPPYGAPPMAPPMAPQFVGPQLPTGYNILDAFQGGNTVQLISKLTNKPMTCLKGATNTNGAFGKDNSTFTVVIPKGAAQGIIMLHNTVSTGLYLSVNKTGFFNVGKGRKWSHLQPLVQPDNSVSFKSVEFGGLVCFNQKGAPAKAANMQDLGSQFFIRIERQTGVPSQPINTPFGRPSIANQLRTDCLVQLYLKPFNMYLGIDKIGNILTLSDGNNTDTCLKVVDRGMGVFSFESNKYKFMRLTIAKGALSGKGLPDRNADFQLKENPDGTAVFESVGTPGYSIGIVGGGALQSNINVALVVVTGVGKSLNIAKTPLN